VTYSKVRDIFAVNYYSTLHVVRAFVPILKGRPEAHITNVSSMGAMVPVPGQTLYGSSKAAINLLTMGLYAELKETSVGVTLAIPGAINTDIAANSGIDMKGASAEGGHVKMLAPEKAAAIIIRAVEKNKYRVLVGRDARMMDLISRISPKWAAQLIYKQMKELLG
jgi:short-subunit dehydrogenase